MEYFVYILRSEKFKRNYTGICKNPKRRLLEHNHGKTKSTKSYRPWNLIYIEESSSFAAAREREKFLKSGFGRESVNKLLAD